MLYSSQCDPAEWVKRKRRRERGREGEQKRDRKRASLCPSLQAAPAARADVLGLDAALMTGLGAWDTGPTGDPQVLVDEPGPDSHPARVGLKL